MASGESNNTTLTNQNIRKGAGAMHKVYIDPAFGVPVKNCPMALVASPYTAGAEPEYAILEGKQLARPASAFATAAAFLPTFCGFAQRPIDPKVIAGAVTRDVDDVQKIMVYGVAEVEMTCDAASFDPFDLVGPALNGGGTALENLKVQAVAAIADAYGRVIEDEPDGSYPFAGTTTKVRFRGFSKYYNA